LRSDADSRIVAAAGNLLTDFQFHHASVDLQPNRLGVEAEAARLAIRFLDGAPTLSTNSPFKSVEEAGERLKYKPTGISVRPCEVSLLRISRDETRWRYRLRAFEVEACDFLQPFGAIPEIAYELEPIDYRWNRAERIRVST